MKVFVAFGYNERDKWIPDFVIPILQVFEIEVVTGEEMPGKDIPDEVRERITNSDAMLAFLTRREEAGNLTNNSHQWVIDEVMIAFGAKVKRIIEVRENGVVIPQGVSKNQNLQSLQYNSDERDKFLVEIVKVARGLGDTTLRIMLFPREFYDEVTNLIEERIKCEYRFMVGSRDTQWYPGKLLDFGASIGIDVNISELPQKRDNTTIEVLVTDRATNKELWRSAYEPIDQRKVTMKKRGNV
jgi:hypothetical protein